MGHMDADRGINLCGKSRKLDGINKSRVCCKVTKEGRRGRKYSMCLVIYLMYINPENIDLIDELRSTKFETSGLI